MAKKEKKETKQKSSYFKEMKAELKKVVWPTPKELANNTTAVIAFVFIIALIVFICDFCFDNLNKYGITKMQEKVQSSFQTTNDSENNTSEEQNETSENTDENTNNSEENSESNSEENLENIEVNSSTENQENNTESNE